MAQVLEDLLSEDEVLDMPDETLEAFVKMFSQELFKALIEYTESSGANPAVTEKLNTAVGSIITRNTFHTKVNARGIKATTYNSQLKVLPQKIFSGEIDADALIEDLTWLDENTHNLSSTLPMRTKVMYDDALARIREYEANPVVHHDNHISEQMILYKDLLFFPKQTKPVETGMRSLTLNRKKWTMQLAAAKYLKYCVQNGISPEIAREI